MAFCSYLYLLYRMLCTLFLFLYLEEGNTGVIVLVQLHWGGGGTECVQLLERGKKKKKPPWECFYFYFYFLARGSTRAQKKKKDDSLDMED